LFENNKKYNYFLVFSVNDVLFIILCLYCKSSPVSINSYLS